MPEAGRAGRFSSASARNRGGGLLAPPPRVQAREAQKLRSDFFLVRISKSNLWGEGGRNRERGEEDGSLHPSLHPTLRKGELLSLSAERVQATSLTLGGALDGTTMSAPFPDSILEYLWNEIHSGIRTGVSDRLAGVSSLSRRNRDPAATTHSPGRCEDS